MIEKARNFQILDRDFDYRVASLSSHDSISGGVGVAGVMKYGSGTRNARVAWMTAEATTKTSSEGAMKKKKKTTLFSEWGAKSSCGGGLGDYRRWKHVSVCQSAKYF